VRASVDRARLWPPRPRHDVLGIVVAFAFWIALTALVVPALEAPAHVDSITVRNPYGWLAHVEVTAADDQRDGWVAVGAVDRETTHDFAEVLDVGPRWTLRFTYSDAAAEVTLTRRQLADHGWRVTVPDAFAAALRARGVPETPRQ